MKAIKRGIERGTDRFKKYIENDKRRNATVNARNRGQEV